MKKLMLGNAAIARGAYEAGVTFASAYPGTPSTEITEEIAKYDEIYAEWAPNEKVAFEAAIGASIAGARAIVSMKHVGLNVAADPLFTFAYTGVNGGFVCVVADDPGMHSSQNEQDSRMYGRSAHVPMLEPSDSQEAKDYIKAAYELSEKYDLPVLVRTTTRLSHSNSFVTLEDRKQIPLKEYVKDVAKYVMMPSNAKLRHIALEEKMKKLAIEANTLDFNRAIIKSSNLGVVCSGDVYQYVTEALPDASVYKIGLINPLPIEAIRGFSEKVKRLIVIEELEGVIEEQLKAHGIACEGKEIFGYQGELSVAQIKQKLLNIDYKAETKDIPVRPPVLCAGCPHRGVFYVLNKLKLTVSADIGCYTLGALPPLNAVDSVICMGASIGVAHGFNKVNRGRRNVVSVIGDSTFIHSGITSLINSVYNNSDGVLIILDNSTTGMTGHQDHPATGRTLKGEITDKLDLTALVKACGIKRVFEIDSYDMNALETAIKNELNEDKMSVIIAKRACRLLTKETVKPYIIDAKCKKCGMCMKIGCPAISKARDNSVKIDSAVCVACGLCSDMCKFGAIKETE
ncbi:MAG: indolepyruvate ferredoxin oxidoreductase subunit alpha [Christensenellales bacterium]|jgi:indolepyruvate ferredoxin oxidoreductase alpha subunit